MTVICSTVKYLQENTIYPISIIDYAGLLIAAGAVSLRTGPMDGYSKGGSGMLDMLAKNWWVYVIRGILALLFGLFAYLNPGMTFKLLLLLFGIFVFTEGIFALIGSVAGRKYSDVWWLVFLEGIAGVILGLVALFRPEVIGLLVYLFIAVWAIWSGLFRIIVAFRLRKEIDSEWLLVFGGVISMMFGAMLLAHPEAGIVAMAWLIGFFAIMFGLLMIIFGMKARKFNKEVG